MATTTNNPLLSISTIKHIEDTTPRKVCATWEQLCRKLLRHEAYEVKEDAPLWCPTSWKEGRPREKKNLEKGNLEEVCCFVVDFDDGTKPSDLLDRWMTDGKQLAYALYSSYNHTTQAPRWRLVIPLAVPVPADLWKTDVWPRLSYHLCNYRNDGQAKDAARFYYFPSCPEDRMEEAFCDRMGGEWLGVSTIPPVPEKVYAKRTQAKTVGGGEGRPGDDFNEKATADDVLSILVRAGCREHSRDSDIISVIRPGKTFAIRSGTIGHVAPNVYYNFSDNFPPLEPNRAYRPFDLFALLECNGDFKAAAKRKAAEGFGSQAKTVELKFDGKVVQAKKLRTEQRTPPDAPETEWQAGEERPAQLPTVIMTNRPDRSIAADCWEAMNAANDPPKLFNRGTGVARIILHGDTKTALIDPVDEKILLFRLRRVADFISLRKLPDSEVYQQTHVPPPLRIAEDMLRNADELAELPPLHSMCYTPVVDSKGSLLTAPGYYRAEAIYLATERLYPEGDHCKPHGDTKADALAALDRLFGENGVYGEFPFVDKSSRAHAIALLLTPFMRPYIDGCAPLFLIEAPEKGTGKSLLARNLLRVSDVSPKAWDAPAARQKDPEAEWNKVLSTALKHQPPTLFFDNVRGLLASTALEGIITSPDPTALRLLGAAIEVTVYPKLLTIVTTSNNAEANRDMARRSVSIRIDAQMALPETRNGFRIKDLDEHIKTNRGEIIRDVLTILAAWIAAGRPEQNERVKGSFERWARIVGGVLAFLGVPGFLVDEEDRLLAMDPYAVQWGNFLEAWAVKGDGGMAALGDGWVSAGDALQLAIAKEIMPHGSTSSGLSHQLRKNRDRIFGEFQLAMMYDEHTKTNRYRVVSTRGEGLFHENSPNSAGVAGVCGGLSQSTRDPLTTPIEPTKTGLHKGSQEQRVNPPQTPATPATTPNRMDAEMEPLSDGFDDSEEVISLRLEWRDYHLGGNLWERAVSVDMPAGKRVGKGSTPLEALSVLATRLNELEPSRERMQALDLVTDEYNHRLPKEEGK